MSTIDRRQFIVGLGVTVTLASPFACFGQQVKPAYHVALVFWSSPVANMAGPEPKERLARVFIHAMRDLGYVEGKNLVLERRSLEGKAARAPEIVAELVRLKVDVIVSSANVITRAAIKETSAIPIVMVANGAPVKEGFIKSLAHPGSNVTGLGYDPSENEVDAKRLVLLREAAPKISRVAYLGPKLPWDLPAAERLRASAKVEGLTLFLAEMVDNDLDAAFETVLREHANALFVAGGAATYVPRRRIIEFAAAHRLPASYGVRDSVKDGGLMSLGVSATYIFQRAAVYVDKILKGANPAELPVERPSEFELVVNLKTAETLGLTIPQSLRLRADELIE